MKLREHVCLTGSLTLTGMTDDEIWSHIAYYYAVGDYGHWFKSADDAKQLLEQYLDDEIELVVNDTVQDYDNNIYINSIHLVTSTINDTNEVYAAALRGEDLRKYGW